MKSWYIFIICMISSIINVISLYNLLLGFLSLLLLLITFITTLFVKTVDRASKVNESGRSFATRQMANYGSQRITRLMNRFAIIFGLVIIYTMSAILLLSQIKYQDRFDQFVSYNLPVESLTNLVQVLSKVGWVFFIISLILVTIYTVYLMKNTTMFKQRTTTKMPLGDE